MAPKEPPKEPPKDSLTQPPPAENLVPWEAPKPEKKDWRVWGKNLMKRRTTKQLIEDALLTRFKDKRAIEVNSIEIQYSFSPLFILSLRKTKHFKIDEINYIIFVAILSMLICILQNP